MHNYYVYILECNDGSYYTGVSNNVERRFAEHETGADPKCYTFKRRPLSLVYYEHTTDINVAIAREKQIKRWSRKKKMALIAENIALLRESAACANESNSKNLTNL